jgi:GrpB-like predicted nucleotidyltransferase (UPF0157 family)
MSVEVVPYREEWSTQFAAVARELQRALVRVPSASVEHVGSTSVPGLAAKPIIDIDVVVPSGDVQAAIVALQGLGYVHRGDLGVAGREAFRAPEGEPRRNVYVCEAGTLNVRNHLAVRDVLRRRDDLRDEYAAVKNASAADPDMDIGRYISGKSEVLQRVLAASSLVTEEERQEILRLNRALG